MENEKKAKWGMEKYENVIRGGERFWKRAESERDPANFAVILK